MYLPFIQILNRIKAYANKSKKKKKISTKMSMKKDNDFFFLINTQSYTILAMTKEAKVVYNYRNMSSCQNQM